MYDENRQKESLLRIFKRDVEENSNFKFRKKQIWPTKKADGESSMLTLFKHLVCFSEDSGQGFKSRPGIDNPRAIRLHWVKVHVDEANGAVIDVFSFPDRISGKTRVRTYIYNKTQKYVVIVEPQNTGTDYYLITAYYLTWGLDQIENKSKKRLPNIH
ncbi:MAG TPA: hypothetical protein VKG26_03010 [Bacteroidia bacterium]|nr:hypothetical protein [Bacteroidia bacterium]